MMDLLLSLAAVDFSFLQQPPMATIFILVLSATIGFVTSLANLRVIDLDEYKNMMIESSRVREETMAAMRSGNQRRISKAQKRQQELMKAQSKMSMDRMKIMLFFMIPFLLIWQVLGNFFGKTIIAYVPFNAPFFGTELTIGNWYILCSISTNIIISRVLGLTFEIDPKES
jgi:uncharacterized membrane protein (DUF106 family)